MEPFEFWEAMPGGKADVLQAEHEVDDDIAEKLSKSAVQLYRVSDAGGRMTMTLEVRVRLLLLWYASRYQLALSWRRDSILCRSQCWTPTTVSL